MAKISIDEFHKFYKDKIEPLLGDLEVERADVQKKCKPLIAILIACFVTAVICIFILSSDFACACGVISFFCGILLIWPVNSIYSKFRSKLKQNVISKILALYGNMYFAGQKDIIKASDIRKMGLFPRFTSKGDDDIIIGIHKETNFVICETRLTHTEKRGKSTTTVTDFKGLIIKIQMNKNFTGKTVIGMKGYINKPDKNFEKVELESVDFMKDRCVYSTDQVDARYILTTTFMERIKELGEVFYKDRNGQTFSKPISTGISFVDNALASFLDLNVGVSAAFIEGYAYLFVPTQEDFFEIPVDKSLFNEELYYNICTELDSILGIVEYLHLDQKLGL